ncbi:hypothetical protein [Streptomyces vietnamensis]|uniref:Uncharacterized protein n=1 Tax=Streptomyces vietnamensis TaxID=362257 RepID=A0A0B5HZX5_9ACTN|nr:hypothetical protein [Streptomyces vietnamensis]AJF65931.1 hypothetical protein SVTN_17575 [Streptomyces vietnamensis]
MAGDNFYGDVVNMHGGTNNQGIVHHHASPDLERALADVLARIEELRGQVEPEVAERLDGASAGLAVPQARRGGLVLLRDLAVTVGAIGQPLLDSVRAALELLAR